MRFRIPSRERFLNWLSSALVQEFGPLLRKFRDPELEEHMSQLRLLVANLAEMSGGPGWVESTTAAIIDLSKQINTLHEVIQHHNKILQDIKKSEDLLRGGKIWRKPN